VSVTDTAPAQRNWSSVGLEHIREDQRPDFERAEAELEWHDMGTFDSMPFSPGEAIQTFIREVCGWKGVRRLAWNGVVDLPDPHPEANGEWAHYGVYGIEKGYANGLSRIYLLDTGVSTLCVRSDFWPKVSE
jgi:hypothetical protein